MADRKSDFALPTLDDLFSTQEERDEARLEKIRDIPLDLIDDFPDHPFHVRDDEDMVQLVESIKTNGVLIPGQPTSYALFRLALAAASHLKCLTSPVTFTRRTILQKVPDRSLMSFRCL